MSKKFAHIAVCVTVALAVVLLLPACGGTSDAKAAAQIESEITSELDDLENSKGSAIEIVKTKLDDMVGDQLAGMGITDDELIDAYMDDFEYQVSNVTVTGESAQADVTLTCRSVSGIVKDFLLKSVTSGGSDSKQLLLDCVKNSEASDVNMTVVFSKSDDGTWNIEDALSEAISAKLL